jgi:hypothetical protein
VTPETIRRVRLMLPMLGSTHDGETLAAVKAINRALQAAGTD